MKKLFLVLMFALVLTGCGKEKANDNVNNEPTPVEMRNADHNIPP